MNEDQKAIAELRKRFLAAQETLSKLERRVTALEMQQTQHEAARLAVHEEQLKEAKEAIELLKLQVREIATSQ